MDGFYDCLIQICLMNEVEYATNIKETVKELDCLYKYYDDLNLIRNFQINDYIN